MQHYVSLLTNRFTSTFYFDQDDSIEEFKKILALRYTNFLCGVEMFESFKYLLSLYPQSNLGPHIDNFVITYAGSKIICSEKLHPEEAIPFSKLNVNKLREYI
jgi:hypothetical protein